LITDKLVEKGRLKSEFGFSDDLFYCWRKAMDKMCIKFEKKYNLFIFQKDRLDSHVDNHV